MTMIAGRYPPTYRSEVLEHLMPTVQHGDSACIVGLAGVGKSNLLRFIQQPDVLQRYLPATYARRTHFVCLHCLPGDQPCDQLYISIAQLLIDLALRIGLTPPELPDALGAYRQLHLLLDFLCQKQGQRIVLVLDEFEALLRCQQSEFLESLRSLRDDQTGTNGLVFVVITHILPQLIAQEHPIRRGKFYALVKDHIFPLPAYSRADSDSMLDTLLKQKQLPVTRLDLATRANLYALTGGHSGLLKAIFEALHPGLTLARLNGRQLVATNGAVRDICDHIWRHLHRDEQRAVAQAVHGGVLPATTEEYLVRRGLLVRDSPPRLFSQLFAFYVADIGPD